MFYAKNSVSNYELLIKNRVTRKGRRGIYVNVYFHRPVYEQPGICRLAFASPNLLYASTNKLNNASSVS